jgi:2-dehydropantoate 2-reductase
MKILVIGAGAVGGYFGGRLARAGRDVTFLVREGRAAQLRRTGLMVKSVEDEFVVTPQLLLAAELAQQPQAFDLILLSTKAYQLEAAMDDFSPAVGPETAILPLLNGMRHLDLLVAKFGEQPVLGGSTRIVADVDAEGRVISMETLHDVVFGERNRSLTPRVAAIAETLSGAGFDDKLVPDILASMWQKWVFLAALGATTCLLRGSIGDAVAVPYGVETSAAILAECEAIAVANGYPTDAQFLAFAAMRLQKPGSPLTASMYRDLQRGGPVEAAHILGDLIARGEQHGVPSPLLRAAFVQLSVYEARRLAQNQA